MVVATGIRMGGCWLSVIIVLAGACKSGDAGTGTSTTTSDASTGASGTSSTGSSTGSSTESSTGTTSTTGMLPTGTSNALTEGGENGPPCPRGDITPDELPSGMVDEPYMATITHGISQAGEAFVDGALPPGVEAIAGENTIDLTGTPTMAGEFPITIISYTGDGGICLPDKDYLLVIEEGGGTAGTGSTGTTGG